MKFVLAPLAGFTDAPFRRLCFEGGAELSYTEMVSAAGLAHGSSPTRARYSVRASPISLLPRVRRRHVMRTMARRASSS